MTIKRRDFLNGAALAVGAGLLPWQLVRAAQAQQAGYPPALTGLRGSHPGSFEVAHQMGWERRCSTPTNCPYRRSTTWWW